MFALNGRGAKAAERWRHRPPPMCELLALSANSPTDMRFSFRGLRRRGGATSHHADGWGLASYAPDGLGLRLYREDAAAAFSPLAEQVTALGLRAHCSIAHIRKATRGVVAMENCHPFHRLWQGQSWVFAHNGHLEGQVDLPPDLQPLGGTDSEAAFCWLLDQLRRRGVGGEADGRLFAALVAIADQLAARGSFNALVANGQWLFAYAGTRLHRLTRQAPFGSATLADDDLRMDFTRTSAPDDVVTLLSTEPLTRDEHWLALEPGEALLLRHGQILHSRQR
ncbi:MAG: class II glutamine amidotransferase [Cyanobacteriota bacterium]|jgi:glutamine amidotransferase|nr:class II glutamine amidotransferase [Cyanobacteriota bacterium]